MTGQPLDVADALELCQQSFPFFCTQFCQVLSDAGSESGDSDEDASGEGKTAGWVPFHLWPAQKDVAHKFQNGRLVVILKARQLGMTWLAVAYALWSMLFRPVATVLLFSLRDDEAVKLKERLRGMYDHLPDWLQQRFPIDKDNDHELVLENESTALAFPATAGDSYTGTLVVIDEADLIPNLAKLIRSVKPTIDAGGKMFLLSRVDKFREVEQSPFKKIYLAAKRGKTKWIPIFLPWHARPGRDEQWYADTRADAIERTHNDDEMAEQYPGTDEEALAPPNYGGRFKADWFRYYRRLDSVGHYRQFGDKKIHIDSVKSRFLTVDPATSVKETSKDDPDWTVISAWGLTPCGLLVWLACARLRVEGPDIYPAIAIVYALWKAGKARIEGGGMQKAVPQTAKRHRLPTPEQLANALPWLAAKISGRPAANLPEFTGQFMNIVPYNPGSQDKLDRAQDMLNMGQAGRLWLPIDEPDFPLADVKAELVRFTGDPKKQVHDDIWDTASMAGYEVTRGATERVDTIGQGKFGTASPGMAMQGYGRR